MTDSLRIALGQLNLLVGDVEGNAGRIIEAACRARDEYRAEVLVVPELALTGYPPEDLLLRPSLLRRVERALHDVMKAAQGIDVVLGLPQADGQALYNCALWLRDGKIAARYDKRVLPNYSVFDEKRYFQSGSGPCVVDIAGVPVGLTVCEDIWHPEPAQLAAGAGAKLLLNLNASPYHTGKYHERLRTLQDRIRELGLPIVYVNLVGGQDELVFDGESMVADASGELMFRAPAFEEGLYVVDVPVEPTEATLARELAPLPDLEASIYQALVLGVRDYVAKNGFNGVVLGLSGGIDSALTLAIAVDALGADQVEAVMMPSRYTADMSRDDAAAQARTLGVKYRIIPIESAFESFLEMLADEFAGLPVDVTEENIQARCRGIVLMAISNKTGRMVLTTGNKSEVAVGYATLYGDMAGGFAPLKDVAKTMVYRLARYRNGISPVIPERVITRPPSAELAPDQKDEDSLPPYEVLDPILERYVEQDRSIEEIVADGFDEATVRRIVNLVLRNEYKRRQAPPGVRITSRSFGKDRRYPITSGYGRMMD